MKKNVKCMTLILVTITLLSVNVLFANETASKVGIINITLLPRQNKKLIKIADDLGRMLKKISDNEYKIVDSLPHGNGVLLALEKDYHGKLKIPAKLANNLEAFVISSGKNKLTIVGKSEKAIENGVYTYLEKLGCRWFFPGEHWTITPHCKNIFPKLNISDAPDYRSRIIWYQYGFGSNDVWNEKGIHADYIKWFRANKQGCVANMSCGHSWGDIARKNKKAFEEHPEYYAMGKNGKRIIPKNPNTAKFCCSNPDLIQLVAKDRLKLLRENKKTNPNAFMVSVDPSDGAHMCYCENCKKLGNGKPSDMVVNLANGVVKYIRKEYPDAWVGFYAYSAHQYPPALQIEPHVYVQMAMGFNNTGYTLDELLEKWGKQGATLGVREYYGVMEWGKNLPGRDRGGKIAYHLEQIPKWHKWGLTSISAESMNSWASAGPGYYIASKLMWNVNEDVNTLLNDFYNKSFGKAAKPIRELYAMWKTTVPILPGFLAKWLIKLDQASKLTSDSANLARINDLKAYVHYLVLYNDFMHAEKGDDARKKYLALFEFTFRIKSRNMVHSYALARCIAHCAVPSSVMYNLPEELKNTKKAPENYIKKWNVFTDEGNPWKKNKNEYTDKEIEIIFTDDLKRFTPFVDSIKVFSTDLVSPPLELEGADNGNCKENSYRFTNLFYLIFDKKSMEIEFNGGRTSHLTLSDPKTGKVLQKEQVRPKEKRKITLKVPNPGLYKIVATSWFTLKFPDDVKVVYEMSPLHHGQPTAYAGPGYFYVPKGTKKFSMKIGQRLTIKDPNGKVWQYLQNRDKSPATTPVPEGCDGKRWEICFNTCGEWFFLDIPPYVSLTPDGYIGPRECFENIDTIKKEGR